jgi:hypothetical protein
MAVETKRPIFVCGENPAMSLYAPWAEQAVAIASFWHVTYSPQGTGNALVLWLAEKTLPDSPFPSGGIFSDNLHLAHFLIDRLTRHFPEFREVDAAALPYLQAECRHIFNGSDRYTVTCRAGDHHLIVEWADLLDQKLITWPKFPAGEQAFDLSTVICPCRSGKISVDGAVVPGEVQTGPTADGHLSSTAFLAFAESWLGPFAVDDATS